MGRYPTSGPCLHLNLHSLFIPPRGQLHTASAVKRASPRLRPTSSLRCHLGYALELEPKPYYPITVIERPARLIIGAVLVGGTSMLLASACAFLSRWRSASGGTLEPTWATGNKDEWLTETTCKDIHNSQCNCKRIAIQICTHPDPQELWISLQPEPERLDARSKSDLKTVGR